MSHHFDAVLFRETHEAYSMGAPPTSCPPPSTCLGAALRPAAPTMAQLLLAPTGTSPCSRLHLNTLCRKDNTRRFNLLLCCVVSCLWEW